MITKIITLATLCLLGIRTLTNVLASNQIDFSAYISTTNAFLDGQNPYTVHPLSLLYPPASISLFLPFTQVPYVHAKFIWTFLSLTCLLVGLHLVFKNITNRYPQYMSTIDEAIFILACLQLFPVKFALAQGQINNFVFLGLILFFVSLKSPKPLLTGFILSILVNLKLFPAIFVIYLLLNKQFKTIVSFLFFYLASNTIIDLFSPVDLNSSFLSQTMHRFQNPPLAYYNQSLIAFIGRLGIESLIKPISLLIITLTSYLATINPKKIDTNLSLFLCCALLISPITWQHYLFWTIPIFSLLIPKKQNFKTVITIASFILININIKNPNLYRSYQAIYSHATIGLLLLFVLLTLSVYPSLRVNHAPN